MCTVTFIPYAGKVFLVSNRDEKNSRKKAIDPQVYCSPSGTLLYPKDGDAGGSWIAMHDNGNAIVLLNGGIEAHIADPPYSRSRGTVLLDLLADGSPSAAFLAIDLYNVEPFTVIYLDNGRLFQGIWDGENKHFSRKDETKPHIWSSVTLYDEEVRKKREGWFNDWLESLPEFDLETIVDFHQFTGDGDCRNDLLIDRDGLYHTVSITGMEIEPGKGIMMYKDLRNNRCYTSAMNFSSSRAVL